MRRTSELVRNKDVTARSCSTKPSPARTKVDPQINAVSSKHYDYAGRRSPEACRRPLHRRAVPPEGPRSARITRTTSGASLLKDFVADHIRRLAQRFSTPGLRSSARARAGIRLMRRRNPGCSADPQSWNLDHSSGGSSAAQLRRWRAHPACRACQRRRRLDPHPRSPPACSA